MNQSRLKQQQTSQNSSSPLSLQAVSDRFQNARMGRVHIHIQHLTPEEKAEIRPGDIFIYDSSKIERWTDNRVWSKAYSTSEGWLIYKEVETNGTTRRRRKDGMCKRIISDLTAGSHLRLVCYCNLNNLSTTVDSANSLPQFSMTHQTRTAAPYKEDDANNAYRSDSEASNSMDYTSTSNGEFSSLKQSSKLKGRQQQNSQDFHDLKGSSVVGGNSRQMLFPHQYPQQQQQQQQQQQHPPNILYARQIMRVLQQHQQNSMHQRPASTKSHSGVSVESAASRGKNDSDMSSRIQRQNNSPFDQNQNVKTADGNVINSEQTKNENGSSSSLNLKLPAHATRSNNFLKQEAEDPSPLTASSSSPSSTPESLQNARAMHPASYGLSGLPFAAMTAFRNSAWVSSPMAVDYFANIFTPSLWTPSSLRAMGAGNEPPLPTSSSFSVPEGNSSATAEVRPLSPSMQSTRLANKSDEEDGQSKNGLSMGMGNQQSSSGKSSMLQSALPTWDQNNSNSANVHAAMSGAGMYWLFGGPMPASPFMLPSLPGTPFAAGFFPTADNANRSSSSHAASNLQPTLFSTSASARQSPIIQRHHAQESSAQMEGLVASAAAAAASSLESGQASSALCAGNPDVDNSLSNSSSTTSFASTMAQDSSSLGIVSRSASFLENEGPKILSSISSFKRHSTEVETRTDDESVFKRACFDTISTVNASN